jgi:hypothetical protein
MKAHSKPTHRLLGGLVFFAALALVLWAAQGLGPQLQQLFHLRAPLLSALVLVGLPPLAVFAAPTMLRSLFVLTTWPRIAVVSATAIVVAAGITFSLFVVGQNGGARFGMDQVANGPPVPFSLVAHLPDIFWTYLAAVLALPTVAFVVWQSEPVRWPQRIVGVVTGIVGAAGIAFGALYLSETMTIDVTGLFKLVLNKAHQAGFIDANGELGEGHGAALSLALVLSVLYGVVYYVGRPWTHDRHPFGAALFYAYMLLLALTLFFTAATFYFDLYRVPVLLVFVMFSIGSAMLFKVDHFYRLRKVAHPGSNDFATALDRRLEHQGAERTVVVVCASGGGIQSAGWTVKVLDGLQRVLGAGFSRAIGLISTVSGSSVGAMYYLDRFDDATGHPDATGLSEAFDAATKDSLDATGWGLVYRDLWRILGLSFLTPPDEDRGSAIELDWRSALRAPMDDPGFAEWREKVLQGKLPIPVFNATIVENGRRFLLGPMAFAGGVSQHGADLTSLYASHDVAVTTAARLSATFPYVTPICRNTPVFQDGRDVHPFHVADGGYFDNYGVFTAIEWIRHHLNREGGPGFARVVFLEIAAFPDEAADQAAAAARARPRGWLFSLFGPILALNSVRGSTQQARNDREIEDLHDACADQGVELRRYRIVFPTMDAFTRHGTYQPPLSWKLTPREKDAIRDAWNRVAQETQGDLQRLSQDAGTGQWFG